MIALPPSARANETVLSCGNGVNAVFAPSAAPGINTPYACPGDAAEARGMSIQDVSSTVGSGQRSEWQATAPAGLVIVGASIPYGQLWEYGINDGDQYGGGFYWAGGGAEIHDAQPEAQFGPLWTPYFGWQVICGANPCTYPFNDVTVSDIALDVQETVGPTLSAPSGLR